MVTRDGRQRDGKRQDAPGELERVRAFINTRDLELGTDALASPDRLSALLTPFAPVGAAELRWAVEVREALRESASLTTGRPVDPAYADILDEVAREAEVRVRFPGAVLAPATDSGVLGFLGGLLAVVGTATVDGTWRRLKICPAEDCRWAFYDHSRNRSGVWCQMSECGNRAKARAFRQRRG